MQRRKRLFNRRVVVKAMNLVKINVVRAKPAQAVINGMHNVLAGKALLVGIVAQRKENLGSNHQLVSRRSKILQRAAQHLFTLAQ